MKNLSVKLTYSNVISTLCLFLLVGGGTAFAASHLGKNSVGSKQLKKNAVTAAKLKNGAVTGSKIKLGTLGTVPSATNAAHATTADSATNAANAANTSVVKTSKGTLAVGQSATVLQYGPMAITAQCKEIEPGRIGEQFLISSSTPESAFTSWVDGSSKLGPETSEEEREINNVNWADSTGIYQFDGPADINVSASAAGGQAFNAFVGEATEKDSNTCWYWLTSNVIG